MSRPHSAPSGRRRIHKITVGDPRDPNEDDVIEIDQFANRAVARELVRKDSDYRYDEDAPGRCVGRVRALGRRVYITAAEEASW